MARLRTLIEAGESESPAFSDPQLTLSRGEMAALVAALRERIETSPAAGGRICIPVDSNLGSLAALVAVLELDASAVLIPRAPDGSEDWPAFCDAVLLPPDAAKGAESAELRPLPGTGGERGQDRVYLRTSGTTGAAKSVIHDTDRLIANGEAVVSRLGLRADDRVMLPVPIHHMFGLGAGLVPALLVGAAVHLVPRGNPLEVFKAQRTFGPTAMFLVPSQCRSIMALNRSAGRARLVVVAGDRLAAHEAASFEEAHGTIIGLYGSSELGAITASAPDDASYLRHVTAGQPLDGQALAIEEGDRAEGAEDVFPMKLRPAAGFLGYGDARGEIDRPAPEVWATGDLVRLHPEGRIEVLGRVDFAVKRDGLLVHMGEVEACLTRAEGVAQAAVVVAGESRRGAGLMAFCALERAGATTEEAILQHCRKALPPRAVPDRLVVLDALPMLPSGKVDRRGLAAEAEALLEA